MSISATYYKAYIDAPQTPLRLTTEFSEKSVKGKDRTLTDKKIRESGTTYCVTEIIVHNKAQYKKSCSL